MKKVFKLKKKAVYLCQVAENNLKVAKCLIHNVYRKEFVALEVEELPLDTTEKHLSEKLIHIFKRLEYNNNPVIISLARHNVTCRYIKVPAQVPAEIDKIASLQASRYLPYPANELISGYQIISTDKEGYAYLNFIIVHKDAIAYLLRILQQLNIKDLTIALSSYGLCSLYNYMEPRKEQTVIVIDVDLKQAEIAIIAREKLLFSRSFKMLQQQNWQNLLMEELNKTKEAYLKEISAKEPEKVIITGSPRRSQELVEILSKQFALPITLLPYWDKIPASKEFSARVLETENSLASLIGIALRDIPESLNLLPPERKIEAKKALWVKERVRLAVSILAIIFILGVAAAKNLDNKQRYLARLKEEVSKIEKEAKPLSELEKRLQFMETRIQKKPLVLDVLYELYKVIPGQVSLINFSYEEENQVILHGQASERNTVYEFVSLLGKSQIFKVFNIKVMYANKKKTLSGEVVDFEIICAKK